MTSANRLSATGGAQPDAAGGGGYFGAAAAAAAGALGDDDDDAIAVAAVSDALTRCCLCSGALLEPVPLDCLHDCCARCLEDDLRRQQQQQQSTIVGVCAGDVRCPLCDHVSVNVRSDQLNAFVAALVLAERAAAPGDGSVVCDLCRENAEEEAAGGGGEPVPPAAFSCAECGQFLCSNCQRQHARFAGSHAVTPWPPQAAASGERSEIASASDGSRGSGSAAAATAGRQCPEHRLPVDLYCFRCKALRCAECAIGCARSAAASGAPPHEAARLDDQRCRDHVASARRRLGNEKRRLGDDLAAAAERALKMSGGGGLATARAADETALLDRKRLLLAAVEAAFATSVGALRDRHDALSADATSASRRADVARRRAERAELYCGALLDSDDAASLLLEQHDRLFTWLARLQADAKAALAEIADVEKSCAAAAQQPEAQEKKPPHDPPQDLVATLTKWFRDANVALTAGGDPEVGAARRGGQQQLPPPLLLQEQPASRKQPRRLPSGAGVDVPTAACGDDAGDEERPSQMQKPSPRRPPARASPAVVRVGQPSGRFAPSSASGGCVEPPTAARSIAFTTYGSVLVAAGRDGLLEYDDRGRLVSAWRPGRSGGEAPTPESCRRWSPTMCTDQDDDDDRGAVTLVCALEDGRAGAVVHPVRGVQLLRRHGGSGVGGAFSSASAASWSVEDGESPPIGEGLLAAPPSAVAFYGCAVVVAAPETAGGKRCSKSRLALLPLPAAGGGRRGGAAAAAAYFDQTVECVVRGAALTPSAVVVAGSSCVGDDCVVEAYGYGGGAPLWRRELSWHVSAVCTPPSGSVVYVAGHGAGAAGCVVALSGDDGRHLRDVVAGDRGAASVALSLRTGGHGCAAAALAVLSADGSCVTLRPVTGWTIC